MTYSAVLTSKANAAAIGHLLRSDHQEDLCFALWRPSTGKHRQSALITRIVLPKEGERNVHGNASFNPQYFERVIGLALREGMGIAFMHSHVGPGWQDMSPDDIRAEHGRAAASMAVTGRPQVGLTLGTDRAWSARHSFPAR